MLVSFKSQLATVWDGPGNLFLRNSCPGSLGTLCTSHPLKFIDWKELLRATQRLFPARLSCDSQRGQGSHGQRAMSGVGAHHWHVSGTLREFWQQVEWGGLAL